MKKILYVLLLTCLVACSNNPGKTKSEKIDHLLQQAYEEKQFTGNVLVADQGVVIYKKSFGNADHANKLPNADTTKFLIASISKPITAILILRLAEKGVLKIDDPINKYFIKADPHIGTITLHQLLTHTSGINEIIGKEDSMDISSLLEKATVKFTPGSDFEYSNSGYVILKVIAEITTQKDYAALVRSEVFYPANMTSSGVARNSTLPLLAKGYKDATQADVIAIDFPLENVDGAGSLYSNVEDLYKLDSALYTESLLSKEKKDLMLKQHVPEKYSYGWFVRERGGIWDTYWHKGDLPGFTSFISRRVEKNQTTIILSNIENAPLSDLENDIAKILKATE